MNRLCSTGFSRSPRIFLRSTPRDYRPAFGAINCTTCAASVLV
jgi:hypothetical protein